MREIQYNINYNKSELSVIIITDFTLCILSTLLSFYLRIGHFSLQKYSPLIPMLVSICLVLIGFWFFGFYQKKIKFKILVKIMLMTKMIAIYCFVFFSIFTIYAIDGVPRSIGIIQPIILFFLITVFKIYFYILAGDIKDKLTNLRSFLISILVIYFLIFPAVMNY